MAAAAYTALSARIAGRAFLSQLFARQHVSRADDATLPANRTLFLLNVPLHVSAAALAAAFEHKGAAPIVHLNTDAADARSAHVVFESTAALKRALGRKKPLDMPPARGLRSSADVSSGGVPPREVLQERVGAFMEQFEAAERERELAEEAKHNQMDNDGCAERAQRCPVYCPLLAAVPRARRAAVSHARGNAVATGARVGGPHRHRVRADSCSSRERRLVGARAPRPPQERPCRQQRPARGRRAPRAHHARRSGRWTRPTSTTSSSMRRSASSCSSCGSSSRRTRSASRG